MRRVALLCLSLLALTLSACGGGGDAGPDEAIELPVEGEGYRLTDPSAGRFDPCADLAWVMNPADAPPDGEALVTEAFAALAEASGLEFVGEGSTDEVYAEEREHVQPDRYGDRYAPVLVAWSDETRTPELAGDTAGIAGPRSEALDGVSFQMVTGEVVLDAPDLAGNTRDLNVSIVMHELGHLVGLDHVDDPADIMHESSETPPVYTDGARRGLEVLGAGPCLE